MKTLQDSEIGKDLPCLHCQLIEMGEMACYQDFCPHCGRIPPNRKTYEDQYLEAQVIFSSCQRNLIKTFKIEAMTLLITKLALVFS